MTPDGPEQRQFELDEAAERAERAQELREKLADELRDALIHIMKPEELE